MLSKPNFQGTRIRNLAQSCVTASGSNLSAQSHRQTLRFTSAAALPNPGTYSVTVRACTDAVTGSLPATRPTTAPLPPCTPVARGAEE